MNLVREYRFRLYDYEPSERLFPNTKSYLKWEMVRGCKLSGVKRIRLHDIRHSHASMLLELGTPIKQISERLGHENIETTLQTYSHLYENKEKELVDKLEELCVKHA
jgi:integrase